MRRSKLIGGLHWRSPFAQVYVTGYGFTPALAVPPWPGSAIGSILAPR